MPRETEKPPLTKIDEKPTDGTSTSMKDQDGHGMMKSEKFLQGSEPRRRIEDFVCQDGHGVMSVNFFLDRIFLTELFNVSYTCSSDYSVYDGFCTYTHLLHAHFSAHSALTAYFPHFSCVSHSRMAQVSVKRCLHMCRFSPSRALPSHVSPIFCCLRTTTLSISTFPSTRSCLGMRISARGREVWLSGKVRPQHRFDSLSPPRHQSKWI